MPTASPLVLKYLNEPERDKKKEKHRVHNGNLKLDQVIEIAKLIKHKSFSKQFVGVVKEVLGTCNSCGCTVDGKSPVAVQKEIDRGEIPIKE